MAALSGETGKMETKGKKVRKSNFSPTEIAILTEKVQQNLDVIQSKFTNTVTNQKKAKIWQEITEAVNAVGIEKRTAKEVKDKWKNLSSVAKKEYCSFKKASKETGGGPPPKAPSATSNKIIEIYGDTPQFNGLDGFESDLIEKYGKGEEYEMPCPRCSHPVQITTGGVHIGQSAGSSTRVYCDPDGFECPKCFFKEPVPDEAHTEEGGDPNLQVAAIPADDYAGIRSVDFPRGVDQPVFTEDASMQVKDDVVLATSVNSKKLKRVTQQDVMREQFNALIEKQANLKLKRKKLELEILLLEKNTQKEN